MSDFTKDELRDLIDALRDELLDVSRDLAESKARVAVLREALSEAIADGHNLKAFAGMLLRWGHPGVDVSDEARRVVEHAEKWHRLIVDALERSKP